MRHLLACLFVLLHAGPALAQSTQPMDQSSAAAEVQREVINNIRQQPLGSGKVDDLNLPDEFLVRVADRIILQTYRDRYRIVLPDDQLPAPRPPGQARSAPGLPAIEIRRYQSPSDVVAYRKTLREDRPPLPGFRAGIRGEQVQTWPFDLPDAQSDPVMHAAARLVQQRLARDGLLATVAQLIDTLGDRLTTENAADLLRRSGIPVDLMSCFGGSEQDGSLANLLREIRDQKQKGGEAFARWRSARPFEWKPSGFRIALDSGEYQCGALRLQLTRGDYWQAEGDGCSVDIARQLIAKLPQAKFLLQIEDRYVNQFLLTAKDWPLGEPGRITLLPEHDVVSQWAQDNAKVGFVGEAPGASKSLRVVTLIPRYASRREDGSVFIGGESFLMDRLRAAGWKLIHSPLLFQGGNLIAVRDPGTGNRVLLIGEAEIYRNMALGLTRAQVDEAFRAEFGVNECLVLPAVSFHIDYELSCREQNNKLLVLVNDAVTARNAVLGIGLDRLAATTVLDARSVETAKELLKTQKYREFLGIVMRPLHQLAGTSGGFPASLARPFSTGPADSGVGNLQRFLAALDAVAAECLPLGDWPEEGHSQAFRVAMLRLQKDREHLWNHLKARGWEIVPIPSLAEEGLSINYLNGLQLSNMYLMPAYGGLFTQLDELARNQISRTFGRAVPVEPILCGESQRRVGALRCSAAVYPKTAHEPRGE